MPAGCRVPVPEDIGLPDIALAGTPAQDIGLEAPGTALAAVVGPDIVQAEAAADIAVPEGTAVAEDIVERTQEVLRSTCLLK